MQRFWPPTEKNTWDFFFSSLFCFVCYICGPLWPSLALLGPRLARSQSGFCMWLRSRLKSAFCASMFDRRLSEQHRRASGWQRSACERLCHTSLSDSWHRVVSVCCSFDLSQALMHLWVCFHRPSGIARIKKTAAILSRLPPPASCEPSVNLRGRWRQTGGVSFISCSRRAAFSL